MTTSSTRLGAIRRRTAWSAVLAAIALLAAACGQSEAPAPDPAGQAAEPDESAADEPTSGGQLTVGFTDDQYIVEGEDANLGMYPLNADIFETLTYLNADYEVEPNLATDWELVPPTTWRFHLRDDVVFHDGTPMTAQHVKEGLFDRVAALRGGGPINAGPDSAVVVDDYTIDFTPTEENLRVPEQLVHPQRGVVAPPVDLAEEPVGTGPFQFVEYEPNERIVVERFDDYWGEPAPLDGIEFRFYPDTSSRRLALEAGDIDAMFDVPRADVARLEQQFTIATSNVGAYRALTLTSTEGPLADRRLRQALAYGIDRQALIDTVLEGLAADEQTFVPAAVLGEHASLIQGFDYDPEQARSLIEDAGWELNNEGIYEQDGQPLALKLNSGFPSAEAHRPVPEFLQSHLRELGIEVTVAEAPDSATFYDRMAEVDGDLWLEEGNQNDGNPAFLPRLLYYTGPGSDGGGSLAQIAGPGEAFNDAIAPAAEAEDIDEVQRATAEALHVLIDEATTVIPLAGVYRIYALDNRVQGFEPHQAFTHVRWGTVRLDEAA